MRCPAAGSFELGPAKPCLPRSAQPDEREPGRANIHQAVGVPAGLDARIAGIQAGIWVNDLNGSTAPLLFVDTPTPLGRLRVM